MPGIGTQSGANHEDRVGRNRRVWILAAILLCSAMNLIFISRAKALWGDEALTYYTLHHRSFGALLSFQATTPIVLEPPVNDVLLWCVSHLFGYAKWVLRAPSMLLFLVVQVFIYRLTALLGGWRAGLIAAAALASTQFANYGAEARPYALLSALTLAALVLWHAAHRFAVAPRRWALAGLGVVIALATMTQFYGAMIVIPVAVAEVVLMYTGSRRFDKPLWLAMGLGLLAVFADIPFLHGAAAYRPSPGFDTLDRPDQFIYTYEWLLFRSPFRSLRFTDAIIGILVFVAAVYSVRLLRERLPGSAEGSMRKAVWSAFLALQFLPVPALLISRFTHAYHPRYAVQCILGLIALLSALAAHLTRNLSRRQLIPCTVFGCTLLILSAVSFIHGQQAVTNLVVSRYRLSPPVQELVARAPGQSLYLTVDECLLYPFFGDPAYRSRIRCVYSVPLEERFQHDQISSLTARVLATKTDLPLAFADFSTMTAQSSAIFAFEPEAWLQWMQDAIDAQEGTSQDVGSGLGGEVSVVAFPKQKPHPR